MISVGIGAAVFVLVFAGGLVGLLLNRRLPAEHLSKETQDVVRLGTGMLSVLASLVLGLLIASGKTTFDRSDRDVRQFSGIVIQLGVGRDRLSASAWRPHLDQRCVDCCPTPRAQI